jgi:hypothetical protein
MLKGMKTCSFFEVLSVARLRCKIHGFCGPDDDGNIYVYRFSYTLFNVCHLIVVCQCKQALRRADDPQNNCVFGFV